MCQVYVTAITVFVWKADFSVTRLVLSQLFFMIVSVFNHQIEI